MDQLTSIHETHLPDYLFFNTTDTFATHLSAPTLTYDDNLGSRPPKTLVNLGCTGGCCFVPARQALFLDDDRLQASFASASSICLPCGLRVKPQ